MCRRIYPEDWGVEVYPHPRLRIKMMAPRNPNVSCLIAGILTVVFLCSASPAQENCSAEVKLLLSPAQTQLAVTAFGARGEAAGHVYLFDTDKLDLLSQGVIVRLRQGASNDLMVKLRPRNGKQFFNPSVGNGKYKCEVDVAGSEGQPSYSITNGYAGKQLPITGSAVFDLLSPEQKQLLEQAQLAIDWSRVHRIADIQSTAWQIAGQGKFRKLTLELWTWPAGQVLELSAKVGGKRGSAAYSELLELAKGKGLSVSPVQKLKTAVVLESVTPK